MAGSGGFARLQSGLSSRAQPTAPLGGGSYSSTASADSGMVVGGVRVGGRIPPKLQPAAPAQPAAMPAMPQAQPSALSGVSSAPPEIKDLQITAATDPRLSGYAGKYDQHLEDLQKGRTREADVFKSELDSDIERQIAQAKENALSSGANWTAQDENRMRSELTRGKNKSLADFEIQSQRDTTSALQGGLDIEKAPFESQLAEKNFSQGTQKLLMDYALGRGGLISEDKKTAVMETGQAIDAYKAFLSMLSGPNMSFNSSFGG